MGMGGQLNYRKSLMVFIISSLTDMFVSLTPPLVDEKADISIPTIIDTFTLTESDMSEKRNKSFTPFISERAVDQPRPLKLIYIGAGISGILAAIKFREAVPGLSLTIYEKNPELGGTWYENQYPGCACGE
jgi:hypothetical protein